MTDFYSPDSRHFQDRYDTRRLADRIADVKVHERFTDSDREFIERLDMFFLATVDASGQPTCSYKGGDPGFVRVVGERELAFPIYDGNGMYLSAGNMAEVGAVGLLFVDFLKPRRMRVDGTSTISFDDPLLAAYPEAQFLVRVQANRIYPNCPRYIHRYELVERSPYVPRPAAVTPVPDWKRSDWAADVLPAGDPARATPRPG
jgi:predicted pyridoxine 5'-phosphate oxidase superfamily flavin-nucleotide-binding protein